MKAATSEFVATLLLSAISIHAAREGGDEINDRQTFGHWISIHAAREGGDVAKGKVIACPVEFQSTPPVKAATRLSISDYADTEISIHAAREGGDQKGLYILWHLWTFQSTPPVKAATRPNN